MQKKNEQVERTKHGEIMLLLNGAVCGSKKNQYLPKDQKKVVF